MYGAALVSARPRLMTVRSAVAMGSEDRGGREGGGRSVGGRRSKSGGKGPCSPCRKGACLKPNVSDYDCAGGSGDGPYYYVQGPITVVGNDHYGLDRDGDGVACES